MEVLPNSNSTTNNNSTTTLLSFQHHDREQLQKAYLALLVESLEKVSHLEQSSLNQANNPLKNDSESSAAQILLRPQARLNTLRMIENSGKMNSIDEKNDIRKAILDSCSNSNSIKYTTSQREFITKILSLLDIESLPDQQKVVPKPKDSELKSNGEDTTSEVKPKNDSSTSKENEAAFPKPKVQFRFTFNCASFLAQLINYRLYDSKKFDKCAELSLFIIKAQNINPLYLEKAFFLFALAHEKLSTLANQRTFLQQSLSLTTKRMQYGVSAVIINVILRSLVSEKLYNLADKFSSKITFPQDVHSDYLARYHFYMGQIRAHQAQYSEALKHLTEASRKCPQDTAEEFQLAVYKYLILVTLLLGNKPEKALYSKKFLLKPMTPYFILTSAVTEGRMFKFNQSVEKYNSRFVKDGTLTLVLRLPSNVRKMAMKLICKAYSEISLKDVANRLELEDNADVQYILQNAITNNVIHAEIKDDVLISKPFENVYSTAGPYNAFKDRTTFCMNLYEKSRQAIKHLNAPDDSEEEEIQRNFDFDMFNQLSDIADDF